MQSISDAGKLDNTGSTELPFGILVPTSPEVIDSLKIIKENAVEKLIIGSDSFVLDAYL